MVKSGKLALLLTGLVFLGTASASAATLVYSNDVLGEIEPCGCRNNPQGGMLRKSQLIERLRSENPSILQLDAGDLLFESAKLPEILHQQSEVQASYLLRSMDLLEHDALVPGEKDFALGLKAFERLMKKSKIRFLAANLKRKSGAAFLKPSAEFKLQTPGTDGKPQTLKVAVLGLVGEKLEWPRELKATSALETARKLVPGLRKKSDLLIALTHQGLEADIALAKAVPGIDLIVGGHSQSFLQTPLQVGSTWIYQSSFRNQYVGVQPLSGKVSTTEHRLIGLDPEYEPKARPSVTPSGQPVVTGSPRAPVLVLQMKEILAASKKEIAEINAKTELSLTRQSTPAHGEAAPLQSFSKCAECHLKQFDFWRKTDHGRALQPLIEAKQAQNLDCLRCHSVGQGVPSGYQSVQQLAELHAGPAGGEGADANQVKPYPLEDLGPFLKAMHEAKSLETPVKLTRDSKSLPLRSVLNQINRSFAPVQCENCHSPGGEHPFSGNYTKEVKAESCLKCHTADRAPGWYLPSGKLDLEKVAQKRLSITCPAGDLEPVD